MVSYESLPSFASAPAYVRNRAEDVLLGLPQPLIVLQADRRMVFANANAEHLLEGEELSRRGGRLMGVGQLGAEKLEDLLRQASGGQNTRAGLWFAEDMKTGWLHISPLAAGISASANWPVDSLMLLIQIDEPSLSQTARIEALCKLCRLTNTERYVLMLLADGFAVEAAALQLELQVSTLRTHVRNLLGKTQARSLMQLMRWLGSAGRLLE